MRYLFFCNTPAHVHLYRHAVERLQDRGHDVLILGRDYTCTQPLLEYYDLPYEIYGTVETKKFSLVRELPKHYARFLSRTRSFDPDVIFGIGSFAAHASIVTDAKTFVVADSEPASLDHKLFRPFVDGIFSPYTFRKSLGHDHFKFRGFKETAYLHPDVFERTTDIRDDLGLAPDEDFVVLRFNAWGSSHDVGKSGFSEAQRDELITRLSEHATVFVSDEAVADEADNGAHALDVHPAKILDVLDEASLLVADTQTMTTEAALLGTPAIRSNVFVGDDDMGNFIELEERGLVYNHQDFSTVTERAEDILTDETIQETHEERRQEYLRELVNLTELIVDVATNPDHVRLHEALTPADRLRERATA